MSRDTDSTIGALIRLAGERDLPSAAAVERARAAAEIAWRAAVRDEPAHARRRIRGAARAAKWALAAGLAALAVVGAWLWRPSPALPVARVVAVGGDATLRGDSAVPPVPGSDVLAGATLETAQGRVALALGTLSLRVDDRTRLRFDAADRVTLLEGRIYVDSGGINAPAALRIATPAGAVRHVGTQFQVTVDGALTRIQVREGRVAVEAPAPREVAAGEKLEVRGADAVLTRGQPSHGDAWEWITRTAPGFDIENRLLQEFLGWIAREHGWQLRYADPGSLARAGEVRLHGSLDGLDADSMIERVALITGTPIARRDGALVVGGTP